MSCPALPSNNTEFRAKLPVIKWYMFTLFNNKIWRVKEYPTMPCQSYPINDSNSQHSQHTRFTWVFLRIPFQNCLVGMLSTCPIHSVLFSRLWQGDSQIEAAADRSRKLPWWRGVGGKWWWLCKVLWQKWILQWLSQKWQRKACYPKWTQT